RGDLLGARGKAPPLHGQGRPGALVRDPLHRALARHQDQRDDALRSHRDVRRARGPSPAPPGAAGRLGRVPHVHSPPIPGRDKALNGKRLGRDEGRWLLSEAPLLEVGALANQVRFARIPDKVVTFVIDSNPNYTNVCVTDCQFCAFYRKPGDPEAYTLTVEEVLAKVAFAAAKGATTILLQGGHNPALPLDYYTSLVRETRRRFPAVTPHFFTASEIRTVAQVSRLTVGGVLDRLSEAGQRTLPGGGAEVLSERVRQRIAPKKGGPSAWLEVHREAHRRGFKSTATMMYGHVEQPDD